MASTPESKWITLADSEVIEEIEDFLIADSHARAEASLFASLEQDLGSEPLLRNKRSLPVGSVRPLMQVMVERIPGEI